MAGLFGAASFLAFFTGAEAADFDSGLRFSAVFLGGAFVADAAFEAAGLAAFFCSGFLGFSGFFGVTGFFAVAFLAGAAAFFAVAEERRAAGFASGFFAAFFAALPAVLVAMAYTLIRCDDVPGKVEPRNAAQSARLSPAFGKRACVVRLERRNRLILSTDEPARKSDVLLEKEFSRYFSG